MVNTKRGWWSKLRKLKIETSPSQSQRAQIVFSSLANLRTPKSQKVPQKVKELTRSKWPEWQLRKTSSKRCKVQFQIKEMPNRWLQLKMQNPQASLQAPNHSCPGVKTKKKSRSEMPAQKFSRAFRIKFICNLWCSLQFKNLHKETPELNRDLLQRTWKLKSLEVHLHPRR